MPTTKTRINLSLSEEVRDALAKIARRDRLPQATEAARLLEMAIELEEDKVWDSLANRRDAKNARFVPHNKAWEKR